MMTDRTKGTAKSKKLSQVSMKLEDAFYARLKSACGIQKHSDAQLARILIEWALPYYERARSVEALQAADPPIATGRVSRETQEQLFTALRAILDRAPSTVIERVVEYITERAGKYGDQE
jgi:hypothetical protein